MEQKERKKKRKRKPKKAISLFLALVLMFLPCMARVPGSVLADEPSFIVECLESVHMLTDVNFRFFGSQMSSGIYYWMKPDGSPLFCVQKKARMADGERAEEKAETIDECRYFTREQYEMVSIILQCCGLKKEEAKTLSPGAYLAGQAAVWGIQSSQWTGTEQLKTEMETLYEHVKDWHGLTAEEIVDQAREMTEIICQGLENYFGDMSPYIPAFASKYEEKAPIHLVRWREDGSNSAVFSLKNKSDAVKDFVYRLPEGWSCKWEGDQVIFSCQNPEPGVISVIGTAPEGSRLDTAMPIGLIYIASVIDDPFLQHLTSCVEITAPWSCYFKLSVPKKPEKGSWYLPETEYFRHQEEFKATYGVELEKTDKDTGETLAGVEFQVLEYFDSGQLESTVLDKEQFVLWDGWKGRCPKEITDSSGHISHRDKKEYRFERTYCGGHPEPEILYEGSSEEFRNQLEEEAWQAWEESVEACGQLCDWHAVDGSGREKAEQERDLAYEQFVRLAYGYTFRETKPLEGYWSLEDDPDGRQVEKIFCSSFQAEGQCWEAENRNLAGLFWKTEKPVYRVMAASKSSAGREDGKGANEERTENRKEEPEQGEEKAGQREDEPKGRLKTGTEPICSRFRLSSSSNAKSRKIRRDNLVWLTSTIELLEQGSTGGPDCTVSYQFRVENRKPGKPEETTPEETSPEETSPEETSPEETSPQETTPEETILEETLPEETTPEETLPEESMPEEAIPKETSPVRSPGSGGGGGDGGRKPQLPLPSLAEQVSQPESVPPVLPEEILRSGWIRANYAPPVLLDENGIPLAVGKGRNFRLPETGEQKNGTGCLIGLMAVSGFLALFRFRKRSKEFWKNGKEKQTCRGVLPWVLLSLLLSVVISINVRAEENVKAEGNMPIVENPQTEENKQRDESELLLYIPAEEREEYIPDQCYVDESGQKYELISCRLTEREKPETEERVRKIYTFEGLEEESLVPEKIMFPFRETEGTSGGEGQLERTQILAVSRYWADGFFVPLTFYEYGSDYYDFREEQIPKGGELAYLFEHQYLILEEIGRHREQYQIEGIIWDGESYVDQGISCRKAMAFGKKLLTDYVAAYEGILRYPKTMETLWEVRYRPMAEIVLEPDSVIAPESESVLAEGSVPKKELPVQESESMEAVWKLFKTLAVYSVSMAVFIPVLIYLILLFRKKKQTLSGR